jgi:Tol biopolymer transport system component
VSCQTRHYNPRAPARIVGAGDGNTVAETRLRRNRDPLASRQRRRDWRSAAVAIGTQVVAALAAGTALPAPAGEITVMVRQGTDMSVSASRDGHLVTHVAGRLWRLPQEGGDAVPITPPGEIARHPALSPDGRTLAYESLRGGAFQVILSKPDGSEARQVTSGPWHHMLPAWAADGRRLALASDRDGEFGVWELDTESLALRQLSFEQGIELDPAWDPTGAALAYISIQRGRSSLVIRDPSGKTRTVLAADRGPLRAPSWRPDGSVITYVTQAPAGPRLQMVILSDPPVSKPAAPNEAAATAPVSWLDRNRFVYAADGQLRQREFAAAQVSEVPFQAAVLVRARAAPSARRLPGSADAQPVRGLAGIAPQPGGRLIAAALGDLWELDGAGQVLRQLTQDAAVDFDPAASPDGRSLAFISDRSGSSQVWILDLATHEMRRLTAEAGAARHPAWSPRAQRLAYLAIVAGGAGEATLKILVPKSGAVTEIANGLDPGNPPAWSPDEAWIGVVQNEAGSPQLLLFSTGDAGRRRITLPVEAVGGGVASVQWSTDGRTVLISSGAGIRTFAVQGNGLVGAEWRSLLDQPVRVARWIPTEDAVLFTDEAGLGRVGADAAVTRIPVALSWRPAPPAGRTIIRASRVFDGLQPRYLFNHDVVVDGSRIVAVQPWTAATPEAGTRVIDARGKTVTPGLIDAAVDLRAVAGERPGRALLAFGVTTVHALDAGSELADLAERWQARRSGPRILQSRQVCGTGGWPAPDPTPAMLPGALRVCAGAVGDIGDWAAKARSLGTPVWSAVWLMAASGFVDAVNPMELGGHAPWHALFSGSGGYYQDAVDVLIHSGAALLPGLAGAAWPWLIEEEWDLLRSSQYLQLYAPEEREALANEWRRLRQEQGAGQRNWLRDRQRLVSRIVAGGGEVAAGSGAAAAALGLALHAEIRHLGRAGGLKPGKALEMATSAAARAVGLQEEIGAIAPGRVADLLIIDGDPLSDLADMVRIDTVVIGGEARPLSAFLDRPPAALEKFTQPGTQRLPKRPRRH